MGGTDYPQIGTI